MSEERSDADYPDAPHPRPSISGSISVIETEIEGPEPILITTSRDQNSSAMLDDLMTISAIQHDATAAFGLGQDNMTTRGTGRIYGLSGSSIPLRTASWNSSSRELSDVGNRRVSATAATIPAGMNLSDAAIEPVVQEPSIDVPAHVTPSSPPSHSVTNLSRATTIAAFPRSGRDGLANSSIESLSETPRTRLSPAVSMPGAVFVPGIASTSNEPIRRTSSLPSKTRTGENDTVELSGGGTESGSTGPMGVNASPSLETVARGSRSENGSGEGAAGTMSEHRALRKSIGMSFTASRSRNDRSTPRRSRSASGFPAARASSLGRATSQGYGLNGERTRGGRAQKQRGRKQCLATTRQESSPLPPAGANSTTPLGTVERSIERDINNAQDFTNQQGSLPFLDTVEQPSSDNVEEHGWAGLSRGTTRHRTDEPNTQNEDVCTFGQECEELEAQEQLSEERKSLLIRTCVVTIVILAVIGIIVGFSVGFLHRKSPPGRPKSPSPRSFGNSPCVYRLPSEDSTERYDTIRRILSNESTEALVNIDRNGTAQRKALCWLANFDEQSLSAVESNAQALIQRYSVAVLYFSLIEGTTSSLLRPTWLNGEHECEWEAISCGNAGSTEEITSLSLRREGLEGTIPLEIANFRSLQSIHTQSNRITGTIPSSLWGMTSLLEVNFYRNELEGSLPTYIPGLQNLVELDLGSNKLGGQIPTALSLLTSLAHLDLGRNKFNGTVPGEIDSLSQLEVLVLLDLRLIGTITSSLFGFTQLRELNLNGNKFEGTLPSEIGKLNEIISLKLFGNNINGTIPTELGLCTKLEELDLQRTELSGQVPSELGFLSNAKGSMDFRGSFRLNGSMPDQICALRESGSLSSLHASCAYLACDCCDQCHGYLRQLQTI